MRSPGDRSPPGMWNSHFLGRAGQGSLLGQVHLWDPEAAPSEPCRGPKQKGPL